MSEITISQNVGDFFFSAGDDVREAKLIIFVFRLFFDMKLLLNLFRMRHSE